MVLLYGVFAVLLVSPAYWGLLIINLSLVFIGVYVVTSAHQHEVGEELLHCLSLLIFRAICFMTGGTLCVN